MNKSVFNGISHQLNDTYTQPKMLFFEQRKNNDAVYMAYSVRNMCILVLLQCIVGMGT